MSAAAGPGDQARDLRTLPKAHLHLHLDGAIRASTVAELSAEQGLAVPALPRGDAYPDFSAFMATIAATHALLQDADVLTRVTTEIVADDAADGAVWIELSVWPGVFRDRLGEREALEAILEAGRDEAARLGVGFGVMVAANRHEGPAAARQVAQTALAYAGAGVVSFGLDGDETVHAAEEFAEAFALARAGGLHATPHAGELRGSDSVAAALDVLHADRVLHGVRAAEDPELLARLANSGVCLDVCLTSNVKLSVYKAMAEHPLPDLLHAGVACSLNADDPLLFATSLLAEYERARVELGLADEALARIATTSVLNARLDDASRRGALQAIRGWMGDD